MKTTSPAVAITAAISLFPSAVSSHADPKNGKTAIEYDGGGRPTKASMETGFFVSVAAFGFEVLVFVATIVAASAKACGRAIGLVLHVNEHQPTKQSLPSKVIDEAPMPMNNLRKIP
jgi:hypothetical protein